jgi:hypothetical protein
MHLPHPCLNLSQAVFRYSEDHGSGLHLGNDSEHGRSDCLHHVSGIHEPKTHAAGNRRDDVGIIEPDLKHSLILWIQQC